MVHKGSRAYNPRTIFERLAEDGGIAVAVCRDIGHGKCKPAAPKFQMKQQSGMTICWKHMVAKLKAAGVVELACCLSYKELWQPCA